MEAGTRQAVAMSRQAERKRQRAAVAAALAIRHGGVVHRADLRAAGVGRFEARTEVQAGRWTAAGRHTVLVGPGVPQGEGRWWQAVWESGGSGAVLDGAAALVAGGLTGFEPDVIDVSVPLDRAAALLVCLPTRRVVRTGPSGRVYLDVEWEDVGLVVEVDGGQHQSALNPVDDALRQNELTLGRDMVLRLPVLGLRLGPGRVHGPSRASPSDCGRSAESDSPRSTAHMVERPAESDQTPRLSRSARGHARVVSLVAGKMGRTCPTNCPQEELP